MFLEFFFRGQKQREPDRSDWLETMTVLSFDFRRNHPHSVAMIDPTNPRIWKDAAVAGVLFAVVWVLDAILGLLMGV